MKTLKEAVAVWKKKSPVKTHSKLTPYQKQRAQQRAKKAGRPYPNLVDNIWAAQLHETGGAGEWGTTKLTKKYKKDTPGQHGTK